MARLIDQRPNVTPQDYEDADLVIIVKGGEVRVMKDRRIGAGTIITDIDGLITRLMSQEASQPGVLSGKF